MNAEILIGQPYSFCQMGRRSNQEDARYPDEDKPLNPPNYYVVCDGVGGAEAGEIASRTVCDAFASYMDKHFDGEKFSVLDFSEALGYAYSALQKKGRSQTSEMATTLTFLCVHKEGVLAAHIGDSRIYHIRPDVGILYRSDDHSLVNALVHSGNLTPEEAVNHPQSNIITRCMECVADPKDRAQASVIEITDIEAGDYFFLCTDGVLDRLNDDGIMYILGDDAGDDDKIQALATRCGDSDDNNTAYLIPIKDVVYSDDFQVNDTVAESSDTQVIGESYRGVTDVPAKKRYLLFDKIIDFLRR